MMSFFDRFEQLCKLEGLTPTEVGRNINVKQQTISMWKKRNSTPNSETLQRIANYFNVSTEYLLTGNERTKIPSKNRISMRWTDIKDKIETQNIDITDLRDENKFMQKLSELINIPQLTMDDIHGASFELDIDEQSLIDILLSGNSEELEVLKKIAKVILMIRNHQAKQDTPKNKPS